MKFSYSRIFLTARALFLTLLCGASTVAIVQEDVAAFYRNKTIRLMVGGAPAGGADIAGSSPF